MDHLHVTKRGRVWIRHNRFRSMRTVPETRVALLSRPDKMPGPSWSLPAGAACPFAVTGPGTVCGSCYALGGRYVQGAAAHAQITRYGWARRCMRSAAGVAEFVQTMTGAFGAIENPEWWYVRVHDAGDLFSERYTLAWRDVCAALPHMRFWFPTRSYTAPWLSAIVALNALPNVTVRPSALRFDDAPPVVPGLAAGTTVRADGYTCPAPSQSGTCASCRRCWDEPDVEVGYHAISNVDRHERLGARKQARQIDGLSWTERVTAASAKAAAGEIITVDRGRVSRMPAPPRAPLVTGS